MSRLSTKDKLDGWKDQQRPDGLDSYNPGDQHYRNKIDNFNNRYNASAKAEEIKDLEDNWNADYRGKNGKNTPSLREQEQEPDSVTQIPGKTSVSSPVRGRLGSRFSLNSIQNTFTLKNLSKKSSAATILLLLFGGGGFLTILFSPSLAIVQMKEVFTKSLDDQLHSVDQRSASLMRAKMKETTKGTCGAVKIRCRFASISDSQVEKFKNAGIEIERDMSKGFGSNRGQITKMTYTNDTGAQQTITQASDLQDRMLHDLDFRSKFTRGYNPLFASLSDRVASSVFSSLKASKRLVATGNTDEDRQKAVNEAVSGIEDPGGKTLTKKIDDKGNEYYVDENGNQVPSSEVDSAQSSADRIAEYEKAGGTTGVLSGALKGVNVVGYMDNACTVFNSLRFVSALSKVKKLAQAARFAMAMVLTPADSIKAGDAKMEDVSFIGDNLTTPRDDGKVLDQSKIDQPGSASKPPTVADPEAGMNAFDSPGYHIAAYGDSPDLSLRASRFMLAGGSTALLDKVLVNVSRIVTGGNSSPKAVSQRCHYIQNPIVRFTGLAVGVVAGIGSFGLTTALSIGGSVAVAMALPYIESEAGDIIAGNLFQNLSGIDSGDAAYVGAAGIFGTMAMNRGMKPLNKDEGMQQLAANQNDFNQYAETEKYAARSNPFDITNQFSFLGSMARSLVPMIADSKTSASSAMMSIASMVPFSLNNLVKPAKALSGDYFDKCNDPAYQSIGIAAGPFCEVRYGLSDDELAIDPLENIDWMAATGNIDPNSATGDAKDNGQAWNYTKFLAQCVHRTVGWGEDQDENEGDGSNCVNPAYEDMNRHFRIYTMDLSVDQSMDGTLGAASV
jgi:hypothetical protein